MVAGGKYDTHRVRYIKNFPIFVLDYNEYVEVISVYKCICGNCKLKTRGI